MINFIWGYRQVRHHLGGGGRSKLGISKLRQPDLRSIPAMADAKSGQSYVRAVTGNEDKETKEHDMTVENVSASVLNIQI
jgi:hypothetical protein